MTSAQRLRRVFNIDIEACERCGGAMKVLACISDPAVIRKILAAKVRRSPLRNPHPPGRVLRGHALRKESSLR